MKNTLKISLVDKYKHGILELKSGAAEEGLLDEFIDTIPIILNHILLDLQIGIFTCDEARDLGDFVMNLRK